MKAALSRIAARPEEVVFTRSTTEAINLVAYAWGRANVGPGDEILLTEMEHHSNLVPWQMLAAERGIEAANSAQRAARSEHLPQFSLQMSETYAENGGFDQDVDRVQHDDAEAGVVHQPEAERVRVDEEVDRGERHAASSRSAMASISARA